jgi:WD40 repeat protein
MKKVVAAIAIIGCLGLMAWALAEALKKPQPPVPYAIKALFSPDKKRVLTQYVYYPHQGRGKPPFRNFRPVRIWDIEQFQEVPGDFPPINKGVAAFVANGKKVLSANGSEAARVALDLWETDTGRIIHEFPEEDFTGLHHDGVSALGLSADGTVAITSNFRGRFKLWDLKEGKHIRTIPEGHLPPNPYTVSFLADNKAFLLSQSKLMLWDLVTGKEMKSWFVPLLDPQVVLADTTLLLFSTHGSGGHLSLWEFPSGKIIRQFLPPASIAGAMLTPDGKTLLYGCHNGLLTREDVATGNKIWSVQAPQENRGLSTVAFSQDGMLGFTGNQDGTLILWDAVKGTQLRSLAVEPR